MFYRSILLTYAVRFPEINYIQGMSDLLAPLLFTLRDEPLAYWCFTELMKQTLFCQSEQRKSVMEIQLDYLRELIRLFVPEVFSLFKKKSFSEFYPNNLSGKVQNSIRTSFQ